MAVRKNCKESQKLILEANLDVQQSTWIAARAYSAETIPNQARGIPLMAHTSPVYVEVDETAAVSPEDAAFFLEWIDESLEWVESRANIPDPGQRQEMTDLFHKAQRVFQSQADAIDSK